MKEYKSGCDLNSCFMCNTCLRAWLPAIGANRKNFQYNKGEVLFQEGEPVTGIYFVYDGAVKVHKQWGNSKELIVRFAKKGDILGHRGLGKDMIYPVSGTALERTTVCFLELEFFQSTLKVNDDFLFQLMMFFADELQVSERKMRNIAHMPVKGRVALALVRLKEKFGCNSNGCLNIALSRQDLASYAGTSYETIFRIINEFVQDEAIELSGKEILIKDAEKLLNYSRQSNGELGIGD